MTIRKLLLSTTVIGLAGLAGPGFAADNQASNFAFGNGNLAYILQTGTENYAVVTQYGNNNVVSDNHVNQLAISGPGVWQLGARNESLITS